jgi:hypothetical protein
MTRRLCALFLVAACPFVWAQDDAPKRPRRGESFFGLHFDRHLGREDRGIGRTLTAPMIESLLDAARPDFIQVDTKGHPGIASYPTRAGTPAAELEKDPLKLFREVTARRGVALYSHYSGVIDQQAIALHPDWAVVNIDGSRNSQATSFYSPYADRILIPQLKELADYGVDGAWVDGDSWGTKPDFRDEAKAEFRATTGLEPPKTTDDPSYVPYLAFTRTKFKQYVRHYLEAMHAYDRRFQIASNWAYSSFMPEPVELDVDFLSGDVANGNTVYSAAFEARCLAPHGRQYGKPWDLMAWSFVYSFDEPLTRQSPKGTVHVLQEAAETIATGGGFQVYYGQNADLSIPGWILPQVAEVGRFMRERRAFTAGAAAVPQIALLYSAAAFQRTSKVVYESPGREADPLRGYNEMLLDGRHAFEILMEHHLAGRLDDYPLVVVPEWGYLEPGFRDALVDYVRRGGSLLAAGVDAARLFEQELGVRFVGPPERRARFVGFEDGVATVDARFQDVDPLPGAEVIGRVWKSKDLREPSGIAATVAPLGRGRIGAIYADLGSYYLRAATPTHRRLVGAVVSRLFPEPQVRVEGAGPLHLTLNRLGGRTLVNLINAGGPHANPDVSTYDEIVPLPPQRVTLRAAKRPAAVTLQPGRHPLDFDYSDGVSSFTVPSVGVHAVVTVE